MNQKLEEVPSPYDQAEMMYETFYIINKWRNKEKISASKKIDILFKCDSDIYAAIISDNIEVFKHMCKLNSLKLILE